MPFHFFATIRCIRKHSSYLIYLSAIWLVSCQKQTIETPDSNSNTENLISFQFKKADGTLIDAKNILIKNVNDSIKVKLPPGIYLKNLIPDIAFKGASISPASGQNQDFSKPITYSVTAENGSVSKRVVAAEIMQPTSIVFVGGGKNTLYALDALTGIMKWSFISGGSFVYSSPTYKEGIIYAGSIDNYVYAINAINGQEIWKFQAGTTGVESDAICVDSTVYVGCNDDYLYALDAITGNERWRFGSLGNISSSPLTSGDKVFFGSSDSYFYALNKETGELIWKFQTGGMINQSGATLVNDTLYFGSRDGNLYAVNAATGSLAWKYDTEGISLEMSSPTVKDGVVYIGGWYNLSDFSKAGSVYAINASTGELIWEQQKNVGFSSSPCVNDGRLFITGDDGNITALNIADGSVIWQKTIYANSASPAEAHGIVYVGGSGTGYIYAFEAATGNEVWRFATPFGNLGTSSPIVIDNLSIPYFSGDSGILD